MIEVNKKEVERYLGFHGVKEIDEKTSQLIDECIEEMQAQVNPKYIYKTFPLEWKFSFKLVPNEDGTGNTKEKNVSCEFSGIKVESGNLLKNLDGCAEIVMMAITLGPEPDMLVRKAEVRDMMKAYTYQAVGAAMAEAWADEINIRIVEEAKARGLHARPRFSPGYGDFPLEVQKDFERILEMPKKIGVTLSDSLLMTPTKSITAVIGLSEIDTNCERSGCEQCSMAGKCAYSR
ncbi:Vitamin B12 dependent methionine synthase, activation domain [Lachnospiraceae bacterium NE2001]|nr:Vitamin B12 dependent methionine synthase, activation domain [Lachnospiraceae bacterium NE2001]